MRTMVRGLIAALCVSAPTAAQAAPPDMPLVSVTNTQAERVAYCTLLVDGRARTKLAIRPGKTWSEGFDPRRELLLVCDRAKALRFGPLKTGASYRLVEIPGAKIELAEGG
ncbi:hypothetical protein [Phenylobacterium sp. CCH12-B4]|uniref:hypothetical protein n=1 Tax=Phenylobacterium sp. CCH12-B4 TaxID=1768784 RepID=UPI000839EADE|nr:hypothetical protein [Phenylobacterium sp. CCH12-B4]